MALHLEAQKGTNDRNDLSRLVVRIDSNEYEDRQMIFSTSLSSRERLETIRHDLNQEQSFEQRLKYVTPTKQISSLVAEKWLLQDTSGNTRSGYFSIGCCRFAV
jgi:hypothetical protein